MDMDENTPLSNVYTNKDFSIKFTWYPGTDLSRYKPYVQVYGVCFNKEGQILIQKFKDSAWCLPGGTVEEGETLVMPYFPKQPRYLGKTILRPIYGFVILKQ